MTCARCGNFACSECLGPTLCRGCDSRGAHRRLVGHLPALAVCMIVQGVLMFMLGGCMGLVAAAVAIAPDAPREPDAPSPAVMAASCVVFAIVHVVPSALLIAGGVLARAGRSRTFVIIALASGLASVLGCYCGPSGIALCVWGLLVLTDPAVRREFT